MAAYRSCPHVANQMANRWLAHLNFGWHISTSEFAQEFLLVHAVLEGFAAVDEDDGNFVVELAAKFGVQVNVNFMPGEAAAARKLGKAFFDNLA
jgi:hypothetical protein